MTDDKVIEQILAGDLDDEIHDMLDALKIRRKQISAERSEALSEGDRVVFIEGVRPRYLRGVKATVKGHSGLKVLLAVDVNVRAGRYSGSQKTRVPGSTIKRVGE